MQKYKDQEKKQEGSALDRIKEKFDQEKANVVDTTVEHEVVDTYLLAKASKRRVKLKMYQSCGCGGDDVELYREVDGDSPLQDGDRISDNDLEEDDEFI